MIMRNVEVGSQSNIGNGNNEDEDKDRGECERYKW